MKSGFKVFKDECIRLQAKYGLLEYDLFFKYKDLDGSFASIAISESACNAVISLDRKIKSNIKEHALHEMNHLLTHRLTWLGQTRYINDDELDIEYERLTVKLTNLLKGKI